jgi:hypothetical protein
MDKPAKPILTLIHPPHPNAKGCGPAAAKRLASRGTTGKRMFVEGGDGRSAWGRCWRDLCLALANDLGGADILSEAQVSICRRVGAIECELEAMVLRCF